MPYYDRPCADKGLISYRYKSHYGWIMIGAHNDDDALREAGRSTDGVSINNLQVWNEEQSSYQFCSDTKIEETHSKEWVLVDLFLVPVVKPIEVKESTKPKSKRPNLLEG